MTDYYNVLGISKNASQDDIKNAYKKMARKNHPDKGGEKDKFQKIQEAYETLSDPNKRQQYDNPNQMNFDNGFPFGFDHPFFKHHMRQQHQQILKRSDHIYTCRITLHEVYSGTIKKLKVNRKKLCKLCVINCVRCNGNGIITQHMQNGPFTQILQQTCNQCNGTGKSNDYGKCENCNNGFINEDKIFEIVIKKGSKTGDQFIFDGWGEQAIKENETSGNFIVNLVVEDNKYFKRDNLDLLFDVNVSFREAIIGKQIVIPYLDGDFELGTRGFGIINPNKEYIIYEKGLIDENGNSGNMKLKFIINYFDKTFNDIEIDHLKKCFDTVGIN